jgi:hypothetical protein
VIAKLRRERPAYNLIGNQHVEILLAVDTPDHLMAHLCAAGIAGKMNLLLGLAVVAFHSHHDIAFVSHRWAFMRILPLAGPSY